MAKISLARENDKGTTTPVILILLVSCMIGGFGGLPFGALLSAIMQRVLDDSSAPVMYGFWAAPIVLGMLIVFFYVRKDMDTKNYTRCDKCKGRMQPMTEMDTIFYIPAEGDQTYKESFRYHAANMVRVSAIHEIPAKKRGCYVCCYTCNNCNHRIVRIADFALKFGTCDWKESYYYDFWDFIKARGKNDLL